jgi:hypothetical protein
VCDTIHENYERLLNEVAKPLQDTVNYQADIIQNQNRTIDKHVKQLVDHQFTITKQAEKISELEPIVWC